MPQISRKVLFLFFSVLFFTSKVILAQEVEIFEENEGIDTSVVLEQDDSGTSFAPIIKKPVDPVESFKPVYAKQEAAELTGDEYIINRGDCLWDLSARFYNTPWRWREIWNANAYIQNPNLIYPHDKLVIPGFAASAPSVDRRREDLDAYGKKQEVKPPVEKAAEVEYDQESWQDETMPAEFSGIVASPRKGKYMEESFVVPEDWEFDGYVVGASQKKLMIASGDIIFIDVGSESGVKPGTRCGVYRLGSSLRGKDRSIVGKIIRRVAIVEATEDIEKNVATVRVISCNDYIIKGDMVRIIN